MAKKKRNRHQSGNPARRAAPQQQPPQPVAPRNALERFSAPILLRLHRMPRLLVPVTMGLLMAGGLFFEGSLQWLGALFLVLVTLVVLWLYALSWPVLTPAGRIARGLVVAGLAAIAYGKAAGWL